MGSNRQEAQTLYNDTYRPGYNGTNEAKIRERLDELTYQYLTNVEPNNRFSFKEFPDIIIKNLTNSSFQPHKAKRVFAKIETYLIQVVTNPWKKEFHSIREYCGFYQTRIESNLKGCQTIFELAGYGTSEPGVFRLNRFDMKRVVDVAFECLVASVECRIMQNIHELLKRNNISTDRIVHCRMANAGDTHNIANILRSETIRADSISKDRVLALNKTADGLMQRSAGHYNQAHIANKTGQFQNGLSSQNWKGTRVNEETVNFMDHIPYIDTEGQNKTLEEGTHDEHLQASLRLVNLDPVSSLHMLQNKPILDPSDEWSYVRRQLEKDYGKEYYDGTRGDFLKDPRESRLSQVDEGICTGSHMPTISSQYVTTEDLFSADPRPKSKVNSELKMNVYNQSENVGNCSSSVQNAANMGGIFYPPPQPLLARRAGQLPTTCDNQQSIKKPEMARFADINEETLFSEMYAANDSDGKYISSVNSEKRHFSNSAPVAFKRDYQVPRRQLRPKSVSSEMNVWVCPHCTTLNPLGGTVCVICSKSRDSVDGKLYQGDKISSKVCEVCTLANRNEAEYCQACHCRLNGLHSTV